MRLHAYTLDEKEAMRLHEQGWLFKSLDSAQWELVWPNATWSNWPPAVALPKVRE